MKRLLEAARVSFRALHWEVAATHGKFAIRDAEDEGAKPASRWGSPELRARLGDAGRIGARRRLCGGALGAGVLRTRTGVLTLEPAPVSPGRLVKPEPRRTGLKILHSCQVLRRC